VTQDYNNSNISREYIQTQDYNTWPLSPEYKTDTWLQDYNNIKTTRQQQQLSWPLQQQHNGEYKTDTILQYSLTLSKHTPFTKLHSRDLSNRSTMVHSLMNTIPALQDQKQYVMNKINLYKLWTFLNKLWTFYTNFETKYILNKHFSITGTRSTQNKKLNKKFQPFLIEHDVTQIQNSTNKQLLPCLSLYTVLYSE